MGYPIPVERDTTTVLVTKVGEESSVMFQFVKKVAAREMATALTRPNACADLVGQETIVARVYPTPGVRMETVGNLGSVLVNQAGQECFVI